MNLVLNNIEDTLVFIDTDFRIRFCNENTRKKIRQHLHQEALPGAPILDLLPPETAARMKAQYEEVLQGKPQSSTWEFDIDGRKNFIEVFLKPAYASGVVEGILITTKNITEKIEWEAQQQEARVDLTRSEQQYRSLFHSNPQPCWIYDAATHRFLQVNDAAINSFGYSREAFLEMSIFDFQHGDQLSHMEERLQREREEPQVRYSNWKLLKKDGILVFVDLSISSISYYGTEAKLVVANDVTFKAQAEIELRRSNTRFELAARASSEALWEWDILTEEAYISDIYTEVFGWKADEFRKFDEWHDYIHPDDKEATIESYYTAIENPEQEKWEREYRYLKADGSYAHVHDKAVILREENGRAVRVVGALRNITEEKNTAEALRKSNERFLLAGRATSDAIYEWNIVTNELYWGEGLYQSFGYEPRQVTMEAWEMLIHPDERQCVVTHLRDTLAHNRKKIWKAEYRLLRAGGGYCHVQERGFIVRDSEGQALRMIGSLHDISDSKFNEEVLSLERHIFEMSGNPANNMQDIITHLLRGIEKIHTEMMTSVMMVADNGTVQHISAPSLPREYIEVVNGMVLGPEDGSCGAAMHTKKPVIVPDICEDERWAAYRQLAAAAGLRACTSLPILHSNGQVMGTFAIYSRQPMAPSVKELAVLERLCNMLSIVMENRRTLQEIKTAKERFDIMMKATHDLVWDLDLQTGKFYRDPEGLRSVYGTNHEASIETMPQWMQRIHPEDYSRVEESFHDILKASGQDYFDVEYRFLKDDGSYAHVYDRGVIIRNEEGRPIRMIGAAQDISERKRLEKELLNHELEYQKAINQATVDTQEQERSEIGKELHDNVNQVLTTTKLYLDLALSNPELKDELIQKSTNNIITVINEIRQLSRSLMDPSIGDLGLIDSIHDLIENINLTRRLQVRLDISDAMEQRLNKGQKLTIFRIIQETLNNAIKHAKATSVHISCAIDGDWAEVTITDDGIGFDPAVVRKGAGLKNVQNRIYLINGTHTFKSSPGAGCTITIVFPLSPKHQPSIE